jgi:hypothetical protein
LNILADFSYQRFALNFNAVLFVELQFGQCIDIGRIVLQH